MPYCKICMYFTWKTYTLLTTSPLWTTKVRLCLLPLLFFPLCNQLQLPGQWSLKPSAQSVVHLSSGCKDTDSDTLLPLVFPFLLDTQETAGRSLSNSVNNLTEKYVCCKSDLQRNREKRGWEGCPEQGKGLFLSGQCMWIKLLGRDTSWSTGLSMWYWRDCVLWLCRVSNTIHTSMHFLYLVLNNSRSLGFDHMGQNLPHPTSTYWNRWMVNDLISNWKTSEL